MAFVSSQIKKLPVDIPLLYGQRPLDQRHLASMKKNGFKNNVWRRPSVVEIPVELLTNEEKILYQSGVIGNKAYILWDGQHRRALWKSEFGDDLIECEVTKVTSVKEANRMFNDVQDTGVKKLKPEDLFINDVLAADGDSTVALALNEFHKKLKVCVATKGQGRAAEPKTKAPSEADSSWYTVSPVFVDNIKKTLDGLSRFNDGTNVKRDDAIQLAVETLRFAFPSKAYDKLPYDLWGGLSILFYLRSDLKDSYNYENIKNFFTFQKMAVSKLSQLSTNAKNLGGDSLNFNAEATAKGLARMMKDSFNNNKDKYDRSHKTIKILDLDRLSKLELVKE